MKHVKGSSNKKGKILNAASKIILDKGVSVLTLDTVAQEAGISKGGLLYHFPFKKNLIEGMIKHLIDEMESSLDQEMRRNGGNFLLAFVQVSIKNNAEHNKIFNSLFAAIANDPALLEPLEIRYLEWQNRVVSSVSSPEIGTLVRLAMDGLWISDLLNLAPPSEEMRNKLLILIASLIQREN